MSCVAPSQDAFLAVLNKLGFTVGEVLIVTPSEGSRYQVELVAFDHSHSPHKPKIVKNQEKTWFVPTSGVTDLLRRLDPKGDRPICLLGRTSSDDLREQWALVNHDLTLRQIERQGTKPETAVFGFNPV